MKFYTEIQVRELLLKVREYQATAISMSESQPYTDEEVTRMINDGIGNAADHAEEWLNALDEHERIANELSAQERDDAASIIGYGNEELIRGL